MALAFVFPGQGSQSVGMLSDLAAAAHLSALDYLGEVPWEEFEHYWERSPLSLVGNMVTPTMLITGEDDYRTPISETEQYYQALKLRRVETAMLRIPGAGHGINARPSQMLTQVLNTIAWFERFGGEPAAAP